jgi:hypothetical protein
MPEIFMQEGEKIDDVGENCRKKTISEKVRW